MSQGEFERQLRLALSASEVPAADVADGVAARIAGDTRQRLLARRARLAALAIVTLASTGLVCAVASRALASESGAGRWLLWLPVALLAALVAMAASLLASAGRGWRG